MEESLECNTKQLKLIICQSEVKIGWHDCYLKSWTFLKKHFRVCLVTCGHVRHTIFLVRYPRLKLCCHDGNPACRHRRPCCLSTCWATVTLKNQINFYSHQNRSLGDWKPCQQKILALGEVTKGKKKIKLSPAQEIKVP